MVSSPCGASCPEVPTRVRQQLKTEVLGDVSQLLEASLVPLLTRLTQAQKELGEQVLDLRRPGARGPGIDAVTTLSLGTRAEPRGLGLQSRSPQRSLSCSPTSDNSSCADVWGAESAFGSPGLARVPSPHSFISTSNSSRGMFTEMASSMSFASPRSGGDDEAASSVRPQTPSAEEAEPFPRSG